MSDSVSSPLESRIALVTGATRGIGRASALALARAGAHVIATARTQGGLETLDDEVLAATGRRATLVPLDLSNGDGLDQLGLAIHQRHAKLDILVHAGAMLGGLWPVSHMDPQQWDRVVSVNLTSIYRLIRSMEPLLRQSEAGRAIFLTSGRALRPKAFWGGYAATKAGLEALVRCWADEIEHTAVRAVILDPGAMRTRMRAEAFPGEDPETLPDPSEIGPLVVELARSNLGLPEKSVLFEDWKTATADPAAFDKLRLT
ncbi:MAG TPA: SDR family NAD(P)-dependent oxidoreductase [Caulobacteraceae bacterium]|jgi:NAD(P)-dependent dehydrogenase (short-subunit alcohol dehydrogenase family)|nr:SDR family NAD(P)-dependent oxidoreductase [Caulobacteraceae bacterium]